MSDKLRVFVAYSFEKTPLHGEDKSDVDVAQWFIELLKSRSLGYEVFSGAKEKPIPIDDKIKEDIADSSCLIGIFTKRHHEEGTGRWLPSQFVLCEAASAIGFYYNTTKLICGFYEEGLDPKDLALITIGGLELMPFSRNRLEDDRDKFISYLKKIPDILATGSYNEGKILFPGPPYSQAYLRKIFTIYTNGGATVQNITKILITDAARFEKDLGGEITHEIFNRRGGFTPLSTMIGTSIDKRKEKGFLKGICRGLNTKHIDTPLRIRVSEERDTGGKIHISFYDKSGSRLRLKNQDTISYQYAWGLPVAYAKTEQELLPLSEGNIINDEAYNHAEVVSNHGMIKKLVVDMRFEKGRYPLFDKEPFYQQTSSFSTNPIWSKSTEMPKPEKEEDHEMWYQTFSLEEVNFQGRLRVMWRPASAKISA